MSGRARGDLRYGTSSWSEKSWVGPFYPQGTPPGEFLAYYATRFTTVEADVTYYRIPDRRMVEGWERKVPEGFRLCAKFPRSIVHGGEGAKPNPETVLVLAAVRDDVERFLERMGALGSKCGPLAIQLPYFNQSVFKTKAPFLKRLDIFLASLPKDFRYAVEVRNARWIDDELLGLLRRHDVALVWTDLSYMPHPADLAGELDLVTTDFVYGRLIGDRKKIDSLTKTFDRIVFDQSERIERWAKLLNETLERVPEAYVYANNHYAGHGPETIRQLAEAVEAV